VPENISADFPGSRTDRFAKPADTVWTREAGAWVSDTPRCRATSWGHRVELDHPPEAGEVAAHFARWATHHGDKGVNRAYLTFETHEPWAGFALPPAVSIDPLTVLHFEATAAAPWLADGYELRPLASDADWAHLLSLCLAVDGPDDSDDGGLRKFLDWYCGGLRERTARGEGVWCGIWRSAADSEEALVAAAAVFWRGGEARFQNVQTHPDHRRRGLCSALVHHLLGHWQRAHVGPIYIAATTDSQIERLYRRLGFTPCSYFYTLGATPVP
jgi:GNAT superfamily N-acetyltransferase